MIVFLIFFCLFGLNQCSKYPSINNVNVASISIDEKPLKYAGNGITIFVNQSDTGINCTTYDECWHVLLKYNGTTGTTFTRVYISVNHWKDNCFSLVTTVSRQIDYVFTIFEPDTTEYNEFIFATIGNDFSKASFFLCEITNTYVFGATTRIMMQYYIE